MWPPEQSQFVRDHSNQIPSPNDGIEAEGFVPGEFELGGFLSFLVVCTTLGQCWS